MNTDKIQIFDRDLLKMRRARAARNFKNHRFLHDWAEKEIQNRLSDVTRDFPASSALDDIPTDEILQNEKSNLDLITSNLALHSINDLPGMLIQIKRALRPDGLFIGAMFGGETLHELRDSLAQAEIKLKGGLSPRVSPFADKQDMGALMQRAGFALPVIDSERITVTYENMFKLMHELRGMGESNIIRERNRMNPGKALFFEAAQHYAQNYTEPDGRIRATFEIIFLLGWAPHESQQKPLQPGSAQTRLAEALETDEIKTGETP